MITLAQRVRDFRYSKGWGPDELASRAEISRTALYQIESGKTGLPRAGTLRRIALALNVSMDDLLGNTVPAAAVKTRLAQDSHQAGAVRRDPADWIPNEGGPLAVSVGNAAPGPVSQAANHDEARINDRLGSDHQRRGLATGLDAVLVREGELMSKLHDLLHSPMGTGVARIVDDLHVLIARTRNSQ